MKITNYLKRTVLLLLLILIPMGITTALSGCTQIVAAPRTIDDDKVSLSKGDAYMAKKMYKEAIDEYSKIQKDSKVYNIAKKKIANAKQKLREANATPIEKANDALDDGDVQGAIRILSDVPKSSPFYKEAQTMLRKIIKDNAKKMSEEGIENVKGGNYYNGGVLLNKARKDDPSLRSSVDPYIDQAADVLINEGLKQHRAQNLKEAIKYWGQVLEFDTGNSKARSYYNQAVKELEVLNKIKN